MPRFTIHEAMTERLEILSADGSVDDDLLPDLEPQLIEDMYRQMMLARALDDKAIKLQRQGRMGTWASPRGQEAVQVGAVAAMGDDDWLVPAFREHVAMLERGVPGSALLAYWAGDERGSAFPEGVRCFPVPVPVGSQFPHAVGVGMSLKLRGESSVAVAFIGDGATSEGDFHEALNFAGVYSAPTVFIIQNNQWAISVPLSAQTSSKTLAQKAVAYDIPGIQVDGNDVFAVYAASKEAIDRAPRGEGPTLIEALTYRIGDHTTADDAGRYRSEDEVQSWEDRDPIRRLRTFMEARGLWDEQRESELADTARGQVDEMVRGLTSMPKQEPAELFRHMYSEMPWNLKEQLAELESEVER